MKYNPTYPTLFTCMAIGLCTMLHSDNSMALSPCRKAPALLQVWPQYGAKKIPRNATLILRRTNPKKTRVQLQDKKSRKYHPIKLINKSDGIVLVKPKRMLRGGRTYELKIWGKTHAMGRFKVIVTVPFTTSWRKTPKNSRITKANLVFNPFQKGINRVMKMSNPFTNREPGRKAALYLRTNNRGIAALVLKGTFTRGKKELVRWKTIMPFGRKRWIAETRITGGCRGWSLKRPPAPKRGRYSLSITPWSMQGTSGTPIQLSGIIKTSPKAKRR